jgi:hypothetical protein
LAALGEFFVEPPTKFSRMTLFAGAVALSLQDWAKAPDASPQPAITETTDNDLNFILIGFKHFHRRPCGLKQGAVLFHAAATISEIRPSRRSAIRDHTYNLGTQIL